MTTRRVNRNRVIIRRTLNGWIAVFPDSAVWWAAPGHWQCLVDEATRHELCRHLNNMLTER
jgi:hypothetical protein